MTNVKAEPARAPKQKIKLSEIFTRNLLLIILVQILANMSGAIVETVITMGATAQGVTATAIGVGATIMTIVGLICRMPAGALADSTRKRLALIGCLSARTAATVLLATFGCVSDTNYMIGRTIYGFAWAFCGVVLPALVAMMVDRRVMGSFYAILAVVQGMLSSVIKGASVYLFQNYGILTNCIVAVAATVAAIIVIMLLDLKDERIVRATPKERKPLLKSLNFKYLPICLILQSATFAYIMNRNFQNVVAQERGIELASILTITGMITSVVLFFASALCDIIKPKYVVCGLLLVFAIGCILTGAATTYTPFFVGVLFTSVGLGYTSINTVYLMKCCGPTEKGGVQATNFFAVDILSIIAGTLTGVVSQNLGYDKGFYIFGGLVFISIVVILIFGERLMPVYVDENED